MPMEGNYFLGLAGGLALFLYGMNRMSAGLSRMAGERMRRWMARLTSNRISGVWSGIIVTSVVQSSSATTGMVTGLVDAGAMTVRQAVWVIMGANIGTTVTAQLTALHLSVFAPLAAFAGTMLLLCGHRPVIRQAGDGLAGLGFLFLGLEMMSAAVLPLQNSAKITGFLSGIDGPLSLVAAGAAVTAVLQSSSAAAGMLQTLAEGGMIPFSKAVYVLFGQNIGTCVTALLAASGCGRRAKQTALIHLMFNVAGTMLFFVLCTVTPAAAAVERLTPGRPAAQIANMHTLFNVVTTLLLLPAGNRLADAAERILPDRCVRESYVTTKGEKERININKTKLFR